MAIRDRPPAAGRPSLPLDDPMHTMLAATDLTDDDLLREAVRLVRAAHEATAALVRVLMEVDRRRLYLRDGCSSLFVWCVQVLHLDEGAAYNRIEVARAARRCPSVLAALDHGDVSLTGARLLAPHLTASNHADVLARARGRTTRAIHLLVAELAPQPAVPSSLRRLPPTSVPPSSRSSDARQVSSPPESSLLLEHPPALRGAAVARSRVEAAAEARVKPRVGDKMGAGGEPQAGAEAGAEVEAQVGAGGGTGNGDRSAAAAAVPSSAAAAVLMPLSPVRFKLQMTITAETHGKLRHAQDLLRHTRPGGDLADIVDRALTVLVRELERQRWAMTRAPRRPACPPGPSRHIPAFVRRAVWQRDEGQCAFVGPHGRCRERAWLEFHHVIPYAAGGVASIENISLRCRAHNAFEGELRFGKDSRRRPHKVSGPPG